MIRCDLMDGHQLSAHSYPPALKAQTVLVTWTCQGGSYNVSKLHLSAGKEVNWTDLPSSFLRI